MSPERLCLLSVPTRTIPTALVTLNDSFLGNSHSINDLRLGITHACTVKRGVFVSKLFVEQQKATYGCCVSKQPATPKVFDPVKLDQMVEPLNVRVEKVKGNARTLIPLPAAEEGGVQGAGWSKEDVGGLEAWLVNEWSGGGVYAISVTDSSQPVPNKHEWQIFYHTSDYPEKVPPTLSAAVAADRPVPASPLSSTSQVRSMGSFPSAFPNGLPNGVSTAHAQPAYQPPATTFIAQPPRVDPMQGMQMQNMQIAAAQAQAQAQLAAQAQVDAERRRLEEQLKEMQAQLQRAREEQLQTQHRQELERAEARMRAEAQAQNEKFSKLEQMIAQLATTATARPTTDPAIEQLKEQNRMLAAQAEAERREREAERREREMRDLIQRQQDDNRRQMEAIQAQLVAAQANKAPDHMMMFMQENARMQAENAKEQIRMQQMQMERLQTLMMNPRDIMALTKESSNGLDQVTRQLTGAYTDIFNMQRAAVDQILQLNSGGGNETIALIERGLERASSMAERYLGGKTKEAVVAQQTQAQMAQAQATAMQAQAQALAAQAQLRTMAAQPVEVDSGLNGARVIAEPEQPKEVPATVGGVRRLGRTDAEWFGPLTSRVEELRAGVKRFSESLQMQPHRLKEDGSVDGIEPEQAASVILQAAAIVVQQDLGIPAMVDLLGQGRVADFMDVLLPDAPQPYRDDVAQMVLNELQGGGDDDDQDDEDEIEQAAPVKQAKPAAKTQSRARA